MTVIIDDLSNRMSAREEFELLKENIKHSKIFAFDTETTGLSNFSDRIIGFSCATDDGAWYADCYDHRGVPWLECREFLLQKLSDPEVTVIGSNIKYDLNMCRRAGIPIRCKSYELGGLSKLIDERDPAGLKDMAERFLDLTAVRFGNAFKFLGGLYHYVFCDYGRQDADLTWKCFKTMYPIVMDMGFIGLYEKILNRLSPIAGEMEYNGFYIDQSKIPEFENLYRKMSRDAELEAYEIAGKMFNLGSSEQLADQIEFRGINLGKFGAPKTKKRSKATGKYIYSTKKEYLEGIDDPLVKAVLKYKEASKVLDTYLPTYRPKRGIKDKRGIEVGVDTDGRLRGSFNPIGARSGRWTSSKPNLQNQDNRLRALFIAEPGNKLICADYSQLEFRIIGHVSKDKHVINSYKDKDSDLHQATSKLLGCNRKLAKTANFAILYGGGAYKLANLAGIPIEEARDALKKFKKTYKGVFAFHEYAKDLMMKQGEDSQVKLITGRVRRLGGIDYKKRVRTYINTMIQGSAGEIVNIALRNLFERVKKDPILKDCLKFLAQVHDEIVVEVPDDPEIIAHAKKVIREEMEGAVKLRVPLIANIDSGDSWEEAKS